MLPDWLGKLKLKKVHTAPSKSVPLYGPVSAVWEVQEVPGLWVRKLRWPPNSGATACQWSVRSLEDNGEDFEDTDTQDMGYKIAAVLVGQEWPTRREALQAVQAARTFVVQGGRPGRPVPF